MKTLSEGKRHPCLNIFTVNYNDADNLKRTIESVVLNKKSYMRFFIIDGKSSDKSMSIILSYEFIIDGFISEKDDGIYDAMNKVLNFPLCDDDFILWLNSGDLLNDWKKINFFDYQKYDCIFFPVNTKLNLLDLKPKIVYPRINKPYNEKHFFPNSSFMHQGFAIKLQIFKLNLYDISIGLQAENLLMSNCILKHNYHISDQIICTFYLDGISSRSFYSLLKSYLKVAKRLNFSLMKLIYHQWLFITKTLIKIVLPYSFFKTIRQFRS